MKYPPFYGGIFIVDKEQTVSLIAHTHTVFTLIIIQIVRSATSHRKDESATAPKRTDVTYTQR